MIAQDEAVRGRQEGGEGGREKQSERSWAREAGREKLGLQGVRATGMVSTYVYITPPQYIIYIELGLRLGLGIGFRFRFGVGLVGQVRSGQGLSWDTRARSRAAVGAPQYRPKWGHLSIGQLRNNLSSPH